MLRLENTLHFRSMAKFLNSFGMVVGGIRFLVDLRDADFFDLSSLLECVSGGLRLDPAPHPPHTEGPVLVDFIRLAHSYLAYVLVL